MAALESTTWSFCSLAVTASLPRGTTATTENRAPSGFQHLLQPQAWLKATSLASVTVIGKPAKPTDLAVPPARYEPRHYLSDAAILRRIEPVGVLQRDGWARDVEYVFRGKERKRLVTRCSMAKSIASGAPRKPGTCCASSPRSPTACARCCASGCAPPGASSRPTSCCRCATRLWGGWEDRLPA